MQSKRLWKLRTRTLDLTEPRVVGVLNVTPDSFSDGGRFFDPARARERAVQIQEEGADVLEIGAESTRPGAQAINPDEEWRRLQPVLEGLRGRLRIPVALDTRHGRVARKGLDAGIEIVNDVGCARDADLLAAVAESSAGLVVMHTRGEPANMMEFARYDDLVTEVRGELSQACERARAQGVAGERIGWDPGFGFAKTPEQNWALLQALSAFSEGEYPLMVGLSRKRFLREIAGESEDPLRAASVAAAALAAERGALLIRVHDVAATVAALRVCARLGSPAPSAAD